MSLKYAILGVLEAEPMNGYDLGQYFSSSANWIWAGSLSQIYPLLTKLEHDGLIVGEDSFTGKRRQIRYSITQQGIDSLRRWVEQPHPTPPTRDPLLLQALFFELGDTEASLAVLEHNIDELSAQITQWREHRDEVASGESTLMRARLKRRPPETHAEIQEMKAAVFDGLIAITEERVRWAEHMRELLLKRVSALAV